MSSLSQFYSDARPFTLTAANAITAGDLVVTLNGGEAVSATPGQPLSRLNRDNSAAGASISNLSGVAAGYPASNSGSSIYRNHRSAVLSNGNIVELTMGNGTTVDTGLYYQIRSPAGGNVIARTQIVATAGIQMMMLCALSGGGFAYMYSSASDTAGKYGILSNTGATVLTQTALITGGNTVNNNSRTWSMAALTGGGFGIAGAGSANFFSWVFNSAGTLQSTQQTLIAASLASSGVITLGASNGDFVIFADDGTNAVGGRLWRYTSAGAIVGSVQTPFGATNANISSFINATGRLIELAGGNIVVLGGSAGSSNQARAYTTSNTAVAAAVTYGGTNATVPNDGTAGSCVACPVSTGGFVVFYQTTVTVYYVVMNSSAAVVNGGTVGTLSLANSINTIGQLYVYPLGAAGFVLASDNRNNAGPNYSLEIATISTDFVLVASKITIYGSASIPYEATFTLSQDKLTAYFGFWNNTTYQWSVSATCGCSIFGVAQATVAAGAQFITNTVGSFTYNQTFAGASLSFNRRSSTPFGNQGAIMGQTALLFGVQTAA